MPSVADIMSHCTVTVDSDQTVDQALGLLLDNGMSGVPIVDGGQVVGMLTELDLFDVLFDPRLRQRKVTAVMHTDMHTVDPDESLAQAAHIFALHGVRQLPVTRNGQLLGIVSRSDLLRFAVQHSEPLVETLVDAMSCSDELDA